MTHFSSCVDLNDTLLVMSIAIPACFWLVFAWFVFSCPFPLCMFACQGDGFLQTKNRWACLKKKNQPVNLFLLIREKVSFTCGVSADRDLLIPVSFIFFWCFNCLFRGWQVYWTTISGVQPAISRNWYEVSKYCVQQEKSKNNLCNNCSKIYSTWSITSFSFKQVEKAPKCTPAQPVYVGCF